MTNDAKPQKPVVSATDARPAIERIADSAVETVEPLAGGEWSAAFRATGDGLDVVARFSYQRSDFERDEIASTWSTPDLPVPEMVHLVAEGDMFVAVTAYVEGSAFDELAAEDLRATLPSLLRALDSLHEIEPPGDGYGIWSRDGRAPDDSWAGSLLNMTVDGGSRITGWRSKVDAIDGAGRVFDAGAQSLRSVADVYRGPKKIVHGDLLAGNVLVRDREVVAVIDWGCSMYGDPLLDAAMLMFWQPWHPAGDAVAIDEMVRTHYADEPNLEERLRACRLSVGLDAMAYSAHTGRVADVLACAREVAALT